jgi:hypothetical protein
MATPGKVPVRPGAAYTRHRPQVTLIQRFGSAPNLEKQT